MFCSNDHFGIQTHTPYFSFISSGPSDYVKLDWIRFITLVPNNGKLFTISYYDEDKTNLGDFIFDIARCSPLFSDHSMSDMLNDFRSIFHLSF